MNKEKLQQDIDAIREKLAEMEAKLQKQEKKKKYFIPELGETYWTINSCGDVSLETNEGGSFDTHRIATGNCYETEENALKADAKQKAYVRIVRALRDHEEEGCARDYTIFYSSEFSNYFSRTWSCELIVFGSRNKELFSTKDACDWVIDNMQDDLKIYFGE